MKARSYERAHRAPVPISNGVGIRGERSRFVCVREIRREINSLPLADNPWKALSKTPGFVEGENHSRRAAKSVCVDLYPKYIRFGREFSRSMSFPARRQSTDLLT